MKDEEKSREELLMELAGLRERLSELHALEFQALFIEGASRERAPNPSPAVLDSLNCEWKHNQEALRRREERYRAIVEAQTEFVSRHTAGGTLTFVNDAYCRYYGETSEKLIGRTFWHHVFQEDVEQLKNHCASFCMENPVASIEHRCLMPNGEIRWQQWTDRAIFDDQGCIVEFQSVGRDTTERRQYEEDLKRLNEKLIEEHNRRKFLSKSLIELLEKDRQKIAMELHDQVGQILTTLKMDLELISEHLRESDPVLHTWTRDAGEKAVRAIKSIKEIAYGLRPSMLDNLGLVSSVSNLLDDIKQSTNFEIHFFCRNVPKKFDQEKETTIYRVVQEALTNIIKHAGAKNVFISLVRRKGILSLSVEDDGVGFEPERHLTGSQRKDSLGLLIMLERVIQTDGDLTIESRIGGGTHLLAEIPL